MSDDGARAGDGRAAEGSAAPSDRAARRQVSDVRELRALAHPLRIELLELLMRDGPMTATEAGDRLGETPANCSFHLRTLARHGFVQEAPGGKGRQRPWQAASGGLTLDESARSPEIDAAAGELVHLIVGREIVRLRDWMARRRDEPEPWRAAGFSANAFLHLTAEELDEIDKQVTAILDRYAGRRAGTAPAGAREVSFVSFAYPVPPPPAAPR